LAAPYRSEGKAIQQRVKASSNLAGQAKRKEGEII